MKSLIKNIFNFSLPLLMHFLIVVIYNVIVDPFGVIRGDMENQINAPNERFLKMKYIINNSNKYDSYLFGSSRVGKIKIKKDMDQ